MQVHNQEYSNGMYQSGISIETLRTVKDSHDASAVVIFKFSFGTFLVWFFFKDLYCGFCNNGEKTITVKF